MFDRLIGALRGKSSDDAPVSDLPNGIFVVPDDVDDDWNPGFVPSEDDPGDFDGHEGARLDGK